MTVQRATPPVPETAWIKSSYSGGEGGECVETATTTEAVHVRDSKRVAGPILTLGPEAWSGFVAYARHGADPAVPGTAWVKSSYSGAEGGQCVETAWVKSTHSSGEGGQCVETATTTEAVYVRDSKQPIGPVLAMSSDAWSRFIGATSDRSTLTA
ncbi:DUF397 domain-containing protein [Embleya sp. AB8]|uniref:DUF397 domain-containing protein n=1 Tax=Embleya sp. AB8 TaxID=3156304 RepID=UPI003C7970A0